MYFSNYSDEEKDKERAMNYIDLYVPEVNTSFASHGFVISSFLGTRVTLYDSNVPVS